MRASLLDGDYEAARSERSLSSIELPAIHSSTNRKQFEEDPETGVNQYMAVDEELNPRSNPRSRSRGQEL